MRFACVLVPFLLCACGAKSGVDMPGRCDTVAECPPVPFCGPVPLCLDGFCALGPPRDCDDAMACTEDACDPIGGVCSNMIRDQDGDGFADASCGADDCDDFDPMIHPGVAERCSGGRDDECDGRTDCSDLECVDDPICAACEPELCDNRLDDDCDGIVDCEDSDCAGSPVCCGDVEAFCDNAIDDDCDGLVDCLDPECESADVCCVASPEVCNGVDDDCDGVPDDGVACYFLDGVPIAPIRSSECGREWYAYGRPDTASANPVPDVRRADGVVVVLHEGPSGCGASLAVIADQARDDGGGSLRGGFTIDPPEAGGLLVNDDPTAGGGECSYDDRTGNATCDWVWQPCCTDGVMFGPFETDFCISVRLTAPVGVSEIVVQDGPGAVRSRGFGETFEICGQILAAVGG